MEVLLLSGGILLVTWVVASLASKKRRRGAREAGLPSLTPWGTTIPAPLPAGPKPPGGEHILPPDVIQGVQDARAGTGTSTALASAAQSAANEGLVQTASALHDAATTAASREGVPAPEPPSAPPSTPLPERMITWEGDQYTYDDFAAYIDMQTAEDVRLRPHDWLIRLGELVGGLGITEDHPIARAFRALVQRFLDAAWENIQRSHPQTLAELELDQPTVAALILLARRLGLGDHPAVTYLESVLAREASAAAAPAPAPAPAPVPAPAPAGPALAPEERRWEWSGNPGVLRTAAEWRQVFDLIVSTNAWASLQTRSDADLAALVLIARESGSGDHPVALWIESVLLARSREREAAAVVPAGPAPAPAPAPSAAVPGYDPNLARQLAPTLDAALRRLGTGDRNTRSRRQTGATLTAIESFARAAFGDAYADREKARIGFVAYGGGIRGALIFYGISNPPQPLVAPLTTQTYVAPGGAVA